MKHEWQQFGIQKKKKKEWQQFILLLVVYLENCILGLFYIFFCHKRKKQEKIHERGLLVLSATAKCWQIPKSWLIPGKIWFFLFHREFRQKTSSISDISDKITKIYIFAGVNQCLGVNQHLAVAPKPWQTPFLCNITFVCTFSWKDIYRWFSIRSRVVVGLVIPSK